MGGLRYTDIAKDDSRSDLSRGQSPLSRRSDGNADIRTKNFSYSKSLKMNLNGQTTHR